MFEAKRSSITIASWEYLGMSRRIRAAGYPRVSDPKLEDSATLDSQTKAIRAHANAKHYELLDEFLYPEAETAYYKPFREREQLMKMLDDAKHKRFDVVIVTEFSRISRRQAEQAVIIALFKEYGVRVESITEQIDEEGPLAEFLRAVYAFASELEHDRIVYRMHRGKLDRVKNGNLTGHGSPKYGYRYIDTEDETNAKYIIDHSVVHVDKEGTKWTAPSVLLFAVEKILTGWSTRMVALHFTRLGIPTPYGKEIWMATTVIRLITDVWYTETETISILQWQRKNNKLVRRPQEEQIVIKRDDLVPVLIDKKSFDRVQEQLRLNTRNSLRSNKHRDQLGLMRAGYAKCGLCGKTMTVCYYKESKKQKPNYRCIQYNGKDPNHSVSIMLETLDQETWKEALKYIKKPEVVRQKAEKLRNDAMQQVEPTATGPTLIDINRQIKNLYTLAAAAADDDTIVSLQAMLRDLERQKHNVEAIQYDLEEEAEMLQKLYAEIDRFEGWCATVRENLTNPDYVPTYEERRLAIQILHLEVKVHPATIKDRFEFHIGPTNIMRLLNDIVLHTSRHR